MRPILAVALGIQLLAALATIGCAGTSRSGLKSVAATTEAEAAAGFWDALRSEAGRPVATAERLHATIGQLRSEAATGEALCGEARRLGALATAHADRGEPLPGAELDALNRLLDTGLAWTSRVYAIGAGNLPWLDCDAAACAAQGVAAPAADLRLTGCVISLAASLTLYDAYLLGATALTEDARVRRALDAEDSAYGRGRARLQALTDDFLDVRHRARVRTALARAEAQRDDLLRLASQDPALQWLVDRALTSPSLATLRAGPWSEARQRLHTARLIVADSSHRLGAGTMDVSSGAFGNLVGAVAFRRGLLFGRPAIEAAVRARLQPGDVLLEKTPFRLTDRFIPGHWGHVAVWVGDDATVATLGVWDDPAAAVHRTQIEAGRGVCEALRDGVQLNPLARFLDIDDLCVLRPVDGSRTREHLQLALRQLGKAYDFNFDVETTDRIVCSELVYTAYTGIDWPTSTMLGRHTISPDQVAARGLDPTAFTVVDLWHDGQRVEGDQRQALAGLLGK
jgi:uncharacterized protein YycO